MSSKSNEKLFKDENDVLESVDEHVFGGLTPRKVTFVKEFVKHGNMTQAALNAGYRRGGAKNSGSRLLQDPEVKEVLKKLYAKVQKDTEHSVEKSIALTKTLINQARNARQFTAVAKLVEHLDAVTGVYNPKLTLDMNVKGSFQVQLPTTLAPPDYALDVTPVKEALAPPKSDEDE